MHFGSRGFGHKTATRYLALAGASGDGMDAAPALLPIDCELGQEYTAAMQLAGAYAYAGRDVVVDRVLEILGASPTASVHNHHNFAWRETHGGEDWWVVRKGCTPAFPGQQGFVGATMGEQSVILEGVDTADARAAFYSTVHGAGRRMSRTQAAGKMGVAYECPEHDCDFFVARGRHESAVCPRHPFARLVKRRRRIQPGLIDYDRVRADLTAAGSSCAAAPPTRRPTPTSGSTRCWPTTATRSACCIASRRSGSPWPARTPSIPTRTR